MSLKRHIRLFALATSAWVVFWILGWPSYYQQYSFMSMLVFDTVLLLLIMACLPRVLRPVHRRRRMAVASWTAFYFTVPLAVYDWLYCGIHLGDGWSFLARYWYITVYYVIPWIVLPGAAVLLNRSESPGRHRGA